MNLYLADTSAWHRREDPGVALAWERLLTRNAMATCGQATLEILFSARSGRDYETLRMRLRGLHQLPCGESEFDRALEVQAALARAGALHHRSVKIPDLLIAASAESSGAVVWHYDADFDRISAVTGQPTEWVAPQGSLD